MSGCRRPERPRHAAGSCDRRIERWLDLLADLYESRDLAPDMHRLGVIVAPIAARIVARAQRLCELEAAV
jgi:hypothetical protein